MIKYLDMVNALTALLKTATIAEGKNSFEVDGSIEHTCLKELSLLQIVRDFQGSIYIKVMSKIGDPFEITYDLTDHDYLELVEEIIVTGDTVTNIKICLMKDKLLETFISHELLMNVNLILFVHTENFIQWFNQMDVEEVFQRDKKTIVLLLDEIYMFENDFIAILGKCSIEQALKKMAEAQCFSYNKQKTIEDRNSNCNWIGGTKFVTPDYFHFDTAALNTGGNLEETFNKKLISLTVPFLSSLTQVENGIIQSIMNGYKTVKVNLSIEVPVNKAASVYSLYSWVYASKTSDKLGILRNISSLYLKSDPAVNLSLFCENIDDVFNSAKSSFEIYLRENVKLYFDQKKKIEESIQTKVKEITQDISSVLDLMNKNIFAAVGLIVGGMLSYINTGNKSLVILALTLYIVFLFLNTSFYGTYTFISVRQANKSFASYIQYIKKTMTEDDVDNLVGDTVKDKKALFYWVWSAMLLLSVVLLFTGVYAIYDINYLLSLVPLKQSTP
jgi:hypothetical protein